jgi:hypothetical protein
MTATPSRSQINKFGVRVRVILRLVVYSQSVHLGAKPPEAHDHSWSPYNLGTDPTENTVSNSSSFIVCISVAAETSCNMLFTGCCIAADGWFLLLNYTVIMSQYSFHSDVKM